MWAHGVMSLPPFPTLKLIKKAYVIGCRNSAIHISNAVGSPEYLISIAQNNLREDHFPNTQARVQMGSHESRHRVEGCRENTFFASISLSLTSTCIQNRAE